MSTYYKACLCPFSLLIFPEGTNMTDETRDKSNAYAAKQSVYNQPYEYCLHPRTTGFTYLLNTMQSYNIVDTVDDITIGYEGNFPIDLLDFVKGQFPTVVHFHIKRYAEDSLPKENQDIDEWLQIRWVEKEDQLKRFYTTKNQFDIPSKRLNNAEVESNVRFQRRLSLFLWIIFITFWSLCIYAYVKIKFYFLLACLFYFVMQFFTNGLIDFICQLNTNNEKRRQFVQSSQSTTIKED